MKTKILIKYLVLVMIISLLFFGCTPPTGLALENHTPVVEKLIKNLEYRASKNDGFADYTYGGYSVNDMDRFELNFQKYLKNNYPNYKILGTKVKNYYDKYNGRLWSSSTKTTYTVGNWKGYFMISKYTIGRTSLIVSLGNTKNISNLKDKWISKSDYNKVQKEIINIEYVNKENDRESNIAYQKQKQSSTRFWSGVSNAIVSAENDISEKIYKIDQETMNSIAISTVKSNEKNYISFNSNGRKIFSPTNGKLIPKRWEDMSDAEKKVEAEKYKKSKASEVKKSGSSLNNGTNTCYIISRINDYFPNQNEKTNVKATVRPIGSKATYGRGVIVGNIELKHNRQDNDISLQISSFEVVKIKQNSSCQFKSKEEAFSKVKRNYNNWRGKHYYIKMFVE